MPRFASQTFCLISLPLLGCAGAGSAIDFGATAATSEDCAALRQKLDAFDANGVPALAARANNGGALNPAQRIDSDSYNATLAQYLSARCHAYTPKTLVVAH